MGSNYYYYDKRLKKIFYKNFKLFILLTAIPVLIIFTSFIQHIATLYNNQLQSVNNQIVNRYMDVCDSVIKEAERYAISVSINDDVNLYVASELQKDKATNVQDSFRLYKKINSAIDEIYLYSYDTGEVISTLGIESFEVVNRQMNFDNKEFILNDSTKMDLCIKNNGYPYVIRIVRIIERGGHRSAIIVDINVDYFSSYANSILGAEGSHAVSKVFLLSDDRKIIYGDRLGEQFLRPLSDYLKIKNNNNKNAVMDQNHYLVSEVDSKCSAFSYMALMPVGFHSIFSMPYLMTTLVVLLFTLCVGMVAAFIMSRKSVSPVYMILSEIDKDRGDTKKIPFEIKYIVKDIMRKIKKPTNADAEFGVRMLLLKLANIQSFEAQINPHFLYNTLDMINWSAFEKLGKENEISELLGELSKIFRISLQNDDFIIPFSEELEHLKLYIELLNRRFENKVNFHFDIDNSCLKLKTIKFILQPLVENAVHHGFKLKKEDKNVWISASVREEMLHIEVSDNGCGMKRSVIEEFNNKFKHGINNLEQQLQKVLIDWDLTNDLEADDVKFRAKKHREKGLALQNINNRIMLIFGDQYGLTLDMSEHGGLKILVKIPMISD